MAKAVEKVMSEAIGTACFVFDFHGAPCSGIFKQFLKENKVNFTFEKILCKSLHKSYNLKFEILIT
jgi:hypothetical protein